MEELAKEIVDGLLEEMGIGEPTDADLYDNCVTRVLQEMYGHTENALERRFARYG